MAKGVHVNGGTPKVAITFGNTLLQKINEVADAQGVSFAEATRRILRKHFGIANEEAYHKGAKQP